MSHQIQLRQYWPLMASCSISEKSKTRQFYFLRAQQSGFQILAEAAKPQAELAAEQLLVMLDEEKLLPEAAKLQQSSQS